MDAELSYNATADTARSRLPKKKRTKNSNKIKKPEGTYACQVCYLEFNRPYNLKRHMMKHTGTHIECKVCLKKCYSQWELKKHTEISHVRALNCELCEKTFKSVEGLRRHNLSVHVMSFKYECKICSKGFHQENQLELHFNSCHLNFRFHCKAFGCFNSFANKKLLCDHKKKFHPELTPQKPYTPREKSRSDIKQYSCAKCGKTYQWASSLSYHSNVCNAEKEAEQITTEPAKVPVPETQQLPAQLDPLPVQQLEQIQPPPKLIQDQHVQEQLQQQQQQQQLTQQENIVIKEQLHEQLQQQAHQESIGYHDQGQVHVHEITPQNIVLPMVSTHHITPW